MPSDAAAALKDMERHIHLANQFVLGMDYTAFESDTRTVFAVIRCLEIISEASRRLPDTLKVRHPSIPRKDIAGAGNIYRHEYEEVAARLVWDTVQLALPELQAVIAQEIRFADLASEEDRSHG
jgi:uncharacterized protein with HEPN domain